jgi:flagellar biosynthesis/type III secretory pathway protein FliH
VTAGQQLIEQGIEQGKKEGRQQGFQEALLRLLRQRFGIEVNTHVEQRVAAASVEQVETWFMRGLSAATLAEVFAD